MCDTLTDSPSPSAWSGRPSRPDEVGRHQRLAVPRRQRVPGAEARPRSAARRAGRAASGPSSGRSRAGRPDRPRPGPRPPPPARDRGPGRDAAGASSIASASGMSNGGSVGPAPVTVTAKEPIGKRSREQVRWVAGEPAETLVEGGAPPSAAATDTPEPTTTISRHPIRSAKERSANVTVAPAASGRRQIRSIPTDLAHRRQAARARREREPGLDEASARSGPPPTRGRARFAGHRRPTCARRRSRRRRRGRRRRCRARVAPGRRGSPPGR